MMLCRHAGGAGPQARRLHRQAQQSQTAGRRAGSGRHRAGGSRPARHRAARHRQARPAGRRRASRRCWARAARTNPATSPRARGSAPNRRQRILAFVAPDAKDEDAHLRQIGTLVGSQRDRRGGPRRAGADRQACCRPAATAPTGCSSIPAWCAASIITPARCSKRSSPFPVRTKPAKTVVFGSVAGGGRYDDLVARFTGQTVPATGISIGVSRLIVGADVARHCGRRTARRWWW